MKRFLILLAFAIIAVSHSCAQTPPWTGIIVSSRAGNWQNAGLPATLPDGETTANAWTPPPRTTICATEIGTVTVAQINSDINTCASGTTVLIDCAATITNAGNNYLTLGANSKNVTVRGCGADKTTIPMGTGAVSFYTSTVSDNVPCSWTGGFSQGTTVVQATLTGGCSAGVGDFFILNGTLTPTNLDPGGVYSCAKPSLCSERSGPTQQAQTTRITNVSGSNYTLSSAIYLDNWASLSQSSEIIRGVSNGAGLEDLTIDCTASTQPYCILMQKTYASWIKGVRVLGTGVNGMIDMERATHLLVTNSYFYGRIPLFSGGNATEFQVNNLSDSLILNNIIQIFAGVYSQSSSANIVLAYNYERDGYGNGQQSFLNNLEDQHTAGDHFYLHEGEVTGEYEDDAVHGTHNLNTFFRNLVTCGDPPFVETAGIRGIALEGYDRFSNVIGNVIGYPGACANYKGTASTLTGSAAIATGYQVSFSRNSGGTVEGTYPVDPYTSTSAMIWGNWAYPSSSNPTGTNDQTGTHFDSGDVPSALNAAAGFVLTLSGSGMGPYSGTIPGGELPCILGSELVTINGNQNGFDNAPFTGTLIGGPTTFGNGLLTSGTVNCTTGAITNVNFSSTPAAQPQLWFLQQTTNASSYQNPVPANNNLPASFFLNIAAHPTGGTGLSWWKVCTNYTTVGGCGGSFQTPPFPNVGSDVTNGCSWITSPSSCKNVWGGHFYDNPAGLAYHYLPIDTAQQKSCAITASSPASGGTKTITIASTCPSTNGNQVKGEFQISSGNCAGTFLTTASTGASGGSQTISYAVSSDPGSCVGENFLFPDIRAFNENVYVADTSGGAAATPTFSPTPGTYLFPQAITITSSSSGVVLCLTTDATTPTANGSGTCTHGTTLTNGGTITASSNTFIQAIASGTGFSDSVIGSATYTFGPTTCGACFAKFYDHPLIEESIYYGR